CSSAFEGAGKHRDVRPLPARRASELEDGPQPAGTGAPQEGLVGHRLEGIFGELQLDVLQLEELLELLDQSVLGLGQDPDQRFLVDRKSTRLNSSHVKISYSVFCLTTK